MKHLLLAFGIGVITVAVSVFVLSNRDDTYESDIEADRTISLRETFVGDNYDLTPLEFDCEQYNDRSSEKSQHGCVLQTELKNTSIFEQVLILDGDKAITADGTEYESSDQLSQELIPGNELKQRIEVDQTVTGGIFFAVPEDAAEIEKIEVYEYSAQRNPITIEL